MTKKEVRLLIKQQLNENITNFRNWSESICNEVISSSFYKGSDLIFAYMALPDEVNVEPIILHALSQGKKVYIPRIIPNTNLMDFYKYNASSTESGSFGITEPVVCEDDMYKFENSDDKILFLVPGRAFSNNGQRVGRGKGFYDLYLDKIIKCIGRKKINLAGVCFPCQILEKLPCENHDILMDKVFSGK